MRHYSRDEINHIAELYHKNKPMNDLIKLVNIRFGNNRTERGVYTLLHRIGINRSKSKISNTDRDIAFSLYFEHGLRTEVIAEKLEIEDNITSLKTLIRNEKKKRGLKS